MFEKRQKVTRLMAGDTAGHKFWDGYYTVFSAGQSLNIKRSSMVGL